LNIILSDLFQQKTSILHFNPPFLNEINSLTFSIYVSGLPYEAVISKKYGKDDIPLDDLDELLDLCYDMA
jgi:hypothetical protein